MSREYYLAKGFANPYRWAQFDHVPFAPLTKPLSKSRVGVVTTASVARPANVAAKRAYPAPTNPQPEWLFTDDLSWHKKATHTNDVGSFLPLDTLHLLATGNRIGSVGPRFYGAPTLFSHTRTSTSIAPEILEWCREDEVDVVLLVPL